MRKFIVVFVFALFFGGCEEEPGVYVTMTAQYHYKQGVAQSIRGEFDAAITQFKTSLEKDSLFGPSQVSLNIIRDMMNARIRRETAIHLFKGIQYGNELHFNKKITELTEAIALDPQYPYIYNDRGIAYVQVGEYQKSLDDRNTAIRLDSTYAEAHYNKALVCEQLGRFDEAIQSFKDFIATAADRYPRYRDNALRRIEALQQLKERVGS